jgi:hypothetical protein
MDFLFYVPFFSTAAAAVTEFRDCQKAVFEPISHFVKILLAVCKNCLIQLDVNKQYLK